MPKIPIQKTKNTIYKKRKGLKLLREGLFFFIPLDKKINPKKTKKPKKQIL